MQHRRDSYPFNASPSTEDNSNHAPMGLGSDLLGATQASGWPWGTIPTSPGSVPQMGFHLYPAPMFHERPSGPLANQSSTSSSSREVPKVPIPRSTSFSSASQRRRSARACEPCRQRKTKCDGNKPLCRQCAEHNVKCYYLDIKRVRDQKQLGYLTKKVDLYEKLLEEAELDVEPDKARRIRRALRTSDQLSSGEDESSESADDSESIGSLDDIDLVDEDLNRNEKTIAAGFFGKNSEVSWIQRLEDQSWERTRHSTELHDDRNDPAADHSQHKTEISIAALSYHLDDLSIPILESVDPYALPPRELADRFYTAFMDSVHPSFMMIRKSTFTSQYRQFYHQMSRPPRRWLAILNMIFAIGCRYCRYTDLGGDGDLDDLVYLNRARKLSLDGNVLFEHADLQQIQVEFLAAFYLISMGQVNRAFKMSSLAFRSALSLGINLRFVDHRTHYTSKEARGRLWWSIFLFEHLLTAMTGRVACVGESLSSAPLPVPYEEEAFARPEIQSLFHDPALRAKRLKLTLFQTEEEAQSNAEWLNTCPPSPSLLFHCIVDLTTIIQAVINNVYSIQGLRDRASQVEQRIRKYGATMDIWLTKVPEVYRFTPPHSELFYIPNTTTTFIRERITLAFSFYSAKIGLCRPCLSKGNLKPESTSHDRPSARARLRTDLALTCLRTSCSLISILPNKPDVVWLTRTTPWWSILHFIMQATTALLLGLSSWPSADIRLESSSMGSAPPVTPQAMVHASKKAMRWLHGMSSSSPASRRAFILCDSIIRRIAPNLNLDLSDLPEPGSLASSASGVSLGGDTRFDFRDMSNGVSE